MKSKRHAKILELITQKPIDTQEELLTQLNIAGFTVTQATVSRDIKELRLVKKLSSEGQYRYATAHSDDKYNISFKFHAIFTESVNSVDLAQNIVVVKCYTGMANAACAAMDSMEWQGIVGTLAGDDTIMVVMRNEDSALALVEQLKKLLGL
ncbi:MAG: arginine repressor [Oscillospiraceae bacterium]